MLNAPRSLFKPYDEFYSGDPAFVQPPPEPSEGASPEAIAKYKEAVEQLHARRRVARETSDWSGLLVDPSARPTRFTFKPLSSDVLAALDDYANGPGGQLFGMTVSLLAVRAALVKVTHFVHPETGDDWKVTHAPDRRWPLLGPIANVEVCDAIWQTTTDDGKHIGVRIIGELYGALMLRANGLHPKS